MSVNRFKPHVFVLPEDDANRQLANGFLKHPFLSIRQIQVLAEARGWNEVLARFSSDHVAGMERYAGRHIVLLIDFDGDENRRHDATERIPEHLMDRVFVLGALNEPEDLRAAGLGSFETIGLAMAQDCRGETGTTWGHELLRHNASELERLRDRVRPILFPSP